MTLRRLGLSAAEKALIVHNDDIGMCHSTNLSSLQAMRAGVAISGSVMLPCPWAIEVGKAAQAEPSLDLGVHATFTSEWTIYRWGPVCRNTPTSTLVDETGCFPRRVEALAAKAEIAEYERELRAQIEMAYAIGMNPTHLDSHMLSSSCRPDILDAFVRIGTGFGLPPLLFREKALHFEVWNEAQKAALPADYFPRLEESGHFLVDHALNWHPALKGAKSLEDQRAAYRAVIRDARPGLNYLFLHMCLDDEEARGILKERVPIRHAQYLIFIEEETRKAARDAGVTILTHRPLQEAFRSTTKFNHE